MVSMQASGDPDPWLLFLGKALHSHSQKFELVKTWADKGYARGIAVYQEETVFYCIQSFTTDSYFGNGKDIAGYR